MARASVAPSPDRAADEEVPEQVLATGWRAFLTSWKLAAIFGVASVLGLIAIVNAHPFASASVSERVSDKLGQPALCTKVGASSLAGESLTIYKCTVGAGTSTASPCFAVSGGAIQQISGGFRKLGC